MLKSVATVGITGPLAIFERVARELLDHQLGLLAQLPNPSPEGRGKRGRGRIAGTPPDP